MGTARSGLAKPGGQRNHQVHASASFPPGVPTNPTPLAPANRVPAFGGDPSYPSMALSEVDLQQVYLLIYLLSDSGSNTQIRANMDSGESRL